jgi:integrase
VSIYKRGNTYWYKFWFGGHQVRESAKTHLKTLAKEAERQRHRRLEEGFNNISNEDRSGRVLTLKQAAKKYFEGYQVRHPRSAKYCRACIVHLVPHLGNKMIIEIDEDSVRNYQEARLRENAAGKTINEEVGELFRIMGKSGRLVRLALRESKNLKLEERSDCGTPLEPDEERRLLSAAKKAKSPAVYPMIVLALNSAMRDSEMRNLTWGRVDFQKLMLTVGQAKTKAGTGRRIPLNSALVTALFDHKAWYEKNVGSAAESHYVFPSGKNRKYDPTKPMATFKTAWRNCLRNAGIQIRLHDLRHTAITKLAESGAGDETIMAIAGHVSRQMLSRYAKIRTEAKRRALEAIRTSPSLVGSELIHAPEVSTESPVLH